jgi:hypothetical protein
MTERERVRNRGIERRRERGGEKEGRFFLLNNICKGNDLSKASIQTRATMNKG